MHASTTQNLEIARDCNATVDAQLFDLEGNIVNLTGSTLRLTAKWRLTDEDADAVFTLFSPSSGITITSAVDGEFTINFVPANTADVPFAKKNLYYDLRLTDADGVWMICRGYLVVVPNVTRTTP